MKKLLAYVAPVILIIGSYWAQHSRFDADWRVFLPTAGVMVISLIWIAVLAKRRRNWVVLSLVVLYLLAYVGLLGIGMVWGSGFVSG